LTNDKNASAYATQIRELIEVRAKAVRAGKPDAILALNSNGFVTFDVLPPFRPTPHAPDTPAYDLHYAPMAVATLPHFSSSPSKPPACR